MSVHHLYALLDEAGDDWLFIESDKAIVLIPDTTNRQ
jgi:hypothetical protein